MSTGMIVAIVVAAMALTGIALLLVMNIGLGDRQIDRPLGHRHAVGDPHFQRVMASVLTPAPLDGNRVVAFCNGDEIFPPMLEAIRSATRSVSLETYIYWSGSVGDTFSDALADASRRGVTVRVHLDWIGGHLDRDHLDRMRDAGVEVVRYNAPAWSNLARLNNRNHRKLLIVDGRIGFIGGVGLADAWSGHAQDPQHWRDTHFQVEGPVVAHLQSAFVENWLQTTGIVVDDDAYFPPLERVGNTPAQLFTASPRGGAKSMQLLYLTAIACATRTIDLSASYFVPDRVAVAELVAAAGRGVRIRIILPGRWIDSSVVRHASRARWGPLLDAGIAIHEFQPTMFHCKVIVIDGCWVSVGSTNFDTRSFSINDEANLNVFDADFAAGQTAIFEDDLARSERITLQAWRARGVVRRTLDAAAALLRLQL